ncbi:phosphatidylserine decarboxylase [Thiocapsa imhoffii]|uniref:Phosphatidylserine decarboxylase proenzyme n=1 Tax=Thiocapsa imhoffii TaxID=382777 RepID=A0A9X1BA96_9GAMM|nr:archaetidylserine decarboxylase [Thiocapsa imhoffii]MBK1646727.1 phosphatidylserine decarboxylase [Thiocapsa imhoffii]
MTQRPRGWRARTFVALQHSLPQHRLSRLMYRLARVRWRPLKDLLIQILLRLYPIKMDEAAEPNPRAYPHFNAFFTRALAPDARPFDPAEDAILSPVDGTISQLGVIEDGCLIQAKGQSYSVVELLGGDLERARAFHSGAFATIYLAPSDYHRIHMPLAGTLAWMTHVPGRLFSVNATTAALVPGLFARNERVVCGFDSGAGTLVMVLVGAIFVGGIETVWAGEVTPATARSPDTHAKPGDIRLERGEEMGRFNLGSTVILLFEPGRMSWTPGLAPGDSVRLGERLGGLRE